VAVAAAAVMAVLVSTLTVTGVSAPAAGGAAATECISQSITGITAMVEPSGASNEA